MKKVLKSVISFAIVSAINVSAIHINTVNAATYQVVDTGSNDFYKYTSAQSINNDLMVIHASQAFNFPVQFDLLTENDFLAIQNLASLSYKQDALLDDIEDIDALKAGTPTANDFAWVVKYLEQSRAATSSATNSTYQKVGSSKLMLNDGASSYTVNVFDQLLADGNLSHSTTEYAYGITNDGWVYGRASAPYLPVEFTNSNDVVQTYWFREFSSRGFILTDNGNTVKAIEPQESRYGGDSAVLDINDNRVGVGYQSIAVLQSMVDKVESETGGCADPDVLSNVPFEECILQFSQALSGNIYSLAAMKYTFDDQANIIASENLGNLVTPHVDDLRIYQNYALAINNNDVAVGYATGWYNGEVAEPKANEVRDLVAVMYKDGNVISLVNDPKNEHNSRAFDINDAGVAVGYVTKTVNGDSRTKFYYIDTNNSELTAIFPDDFFKGSASIARAINNQGMIVGDGEVEIHNDNSSNPRRRHGFLYDINTDTFTDLNKFLTCNSPYIIVSANDINDNNEISATAVLNVERRDAFGNVVKDANGVALTEDVVRAITLKPIAGEIEDCSKVEEKIERQGASFGMFSLLLLPLVMIRRYKK